MIAKQPLLALLTLALFAVPTLAVQPQQWVHANEADFQQGETEQAIVTNLGDLRLATGSETIGETPDETSIIYDLLTTADGTTYLAAGPEGRLLKRVDDQLETVLELEDEQVFALAEYQGKLLLAISGEPSRLAVLDGAGELTTVMELPDVRYVWDVLVRGESLLLATGTEGKVLALHPRDEPILNGRLPDPDAPAFDVVTVLDAAQSNVLCLAHDAKRDLLYAGTDTDGLIYRIRRSEQDGQYESFVVFDAPEPEIGAILVARDGMVYAGTADAEQARPGRLGEAGSEPTGRPETPGTEPDETPDEEDVPEPGDLPQVPPDAEPIGDEDHQPGDAPAQPETNDEVLPGVEGDNDGADNGDADDGDVEGDDGPAELPAEPEPAPMVNDQQTNDEQAPAKPVDDEPAADDADDEQEVGVPEGAEPTSDQRDRLRALIRARLEAARNGGSLQDGAPMQDAPDRRPATAATPSRGGSAARGERPTQPGNAIYRIDADGFVTEVFRESVMILEMIETGDRLIVATGNQGQVFSVRPAAQETSVVVDLEPEQVPALLLDQNDTLLLGTANPAQLVRLDERHANRGTYTSPALDASQISLWGAMRLTADLPHGTSVLIETRSGNVADPEQAPWSAWTQAHVLMPDDQAPALQPRELKVQAPPARFMQYRLTLTGNRAVSPTVSRVELAYVTPNMAPRIRSVRASYSEAASGGRGKAQQAVPSPTMNIEWEASDPNEDQLRYRIEYRPADSTRYLQLADDVEGASHEWDTRRVPDGRYVIRVIAGDSPDNPGDMAMTTTRQSNPVLVDNTPPVLESLQQQVDGDHVIISATAVDNYTVIRSIGVAVNDSETYRPVLPEDLIFDSTREQWSVILDDLSPGANVVTIRVQDARGNTHHQALLIDME